MSGGLPAGMGEQMLSLVFSRDDESEADLVGMELAARAGYNPAAGVTLWQKMGAASKGAPPEFLSTHPSGPTRIKRHPGQPAEGGRALRARRQTRAALRAAAAAHGEQRRHCAAETLKRARRAGRRGPGVAAAQALRALGLVPRAVHPPECG